MLVNRFYTRIPTINSHQKCFLSHSSKAYDVIEGFATKNGTEEFFELHQKCMNFNTIRKLNDIKISSLSIGTYRMRDDSHKKSMIHSLSRGCNLIDTSDHFGGGKSEKLVGETIRDSIEQNVIKRNQLFVISKGGFVFDQDKFNAFQFESGKQFTAARDSKTGNVVHCIDPLYLELVIKESLKNLNLSCLDGFLINCPERMGLDNIFKSNSRSIKVMILEAFKHLDTLVEQNLIKSYGISSNQFNGLNPANPILNDNGDLITIPFIPFKEKSDNNSYDYNESNYCINEMPFNIFENEPVLLNKEGEKSISNTCNDLGMLNLYQRSLTSILPNKIIRLETSRSGLDSIRPPKDEYLELLKYNNNIDSEYCKNKKFKELNEEMISIPDLVKLYFKTLDKLNEKEIKLNSLVPMEYSNIFTQIKILIEHSSQLLPNYVIADIFINNKIKPKFLKDINYFRNELYKAIKEDDDGSEVDEEFKIQEDKIVRLNLNETNNTVEKIDKENELNSLQQERKFVLKEIDIYEKEVLNLFNILLAISRKEMNEYNIQLLSTLKSLLPEQRQRELPQTGSLSNFAIFMTQQLKTSSSVLIGLRKPWYIDTLLKDEFNVSQYDTKLFQNEKEYQEYLKNIKLILMR